MLLAVDKSPYHSQFAVWGKITRMSRRATVRHGKLESLEREFQKLLIACLQECANGRWGLFGQNEHVDPDGRYSHWPQPKQLWEMAQEIREIRSEFGTSNWLCERFVHFRSLRGSNVPGEPKLAAQLLEELKVRNTLSTE